MLEDIVIISYDENSELNLKDILGMGEIVKSALILDVNTLTQNCTIVEHPLIKDFINLITKLSVNNAHKSEIDKIISKLEALKGDLKS